MRYTGIQHDGDASVYLAKPKIRIFVPPNDISHSRANGTVYRGHSRFLVRAEVLEDQYEEDGMFLSWS
jgi:hypothetical protein